MSRRDFGGTVPAAERCTAPGCKGANLRHQLCFRHLPEVEREEHLEQIGNRAPEDRVVDLRGVELRAEDWRTIALTLEKFGTVDQLLVSGTHFEGEFNLHDVEVLDAIAAAGATFGGKVHIRRCVFNHASFSGARFGDTALFEDVEFREKAEFVECEFGDTLFFGDGRNPVQAGDGLNFGGSTFAEGGFFALRGGKGACRFNGVRWQGHASFEISHAGDLIFNGARFEQAMSMSSAVVEGTVALQGAHFEGLCLLERSEVKHLDLRQAIFATAQEVGRIRVQDWAVLDQAVFERQVRLRIQAAILHCHRTTFSQGVSLSLTGDLVADGCFFPPPSDITGVHERGRNLRPRIVSLRRADVAGLTISGVDLSRCLFSGAHHVESSRLGFGLVFGRPPGRLSSPRDVLAEEQWCRHAEDPGSDWLGRDDLVPDWFAKRTPREAPAVLQLEQPRVPDASSVADLYRSLRRAREEGRDSPGSASFYFGEMEMRRLALRGSGLRNVPERVVLAGYWLISGYGLRAWRALASLLLLLVLSTYLLWRFGFEAESVSCGHAGRVAVASATSLVRPIDDNELNGVGFAFEILLRFSGPALLALAALAVRARIKR